MWSRSLASLPKDSSPRICDLPKVVLVSPTEKRWRLQRKAAHLKAAHVEAEVGEEEMQERLQHVKGWQVMEAQRVGQGARK